MTFFSKKRNDKKTTKPKNGKKNEQTKKAVDKPKNQKKELKKRKGKNTETKGTAT